MSSYHDAHIYITKFNQNAPNRNKSLASKVKQMTDLLSKFRALYLCNIYLYHLNSNLHIKRREIIHENASAGPV